MMAMKHCGDPMTRLDHNHQLARGDSLEQRRELMETGQINNRSFKVQIS